MSDISEGSVSFDNPNVQNNERRNFDNKPVNRFRPETNKSYRIKFTSHNVEMRRRHYNPIVKEGARYFRCLDHQGYCPVCVAASNKVGEGKTQIKGASETFGANILVYNTNAEGEVIQPLNAEVYFWAFGSDKFVTLRSIQQDWGPLENLDLKVTCTDGQFQKVSITPLPKCLYNEDANFKAACDKKIQEDSYPLAKFLCKEVSLIELCKVFNLDPQVYIPAELLNQIPANQEIAQDQATKKPEQYPTQSQTAPAAPPTTPVQTPEPPAENFSSLDDLQNLLG